MIQRTLVLIKPDGVQRGIVGEIITRFERIGLKVIGMKMVWIEKDFAKKHYSAHVGKEFYPNLEDFITEGPLVAIAIEGIRAVETVRKIVGATEPRSAAPGTIRGDFAMHSYTYTDKKGIPIKNLIHASGEVDEAEKEVELWFGINELFEYESVHDKHVL